MAGTHLHVQTVTQDWLSTYDSLEHVVSVGTILQVIDSSDSTVELVIGNGKRAAECIRLTVENWNVAVAQLAALEIEVADLTALVDGLDAGALAIALAAAETQANASAASATEAAASAALAAQRKTEAEAARDLALTHAGAAGNSAAEAAQSAIDAENASVVIRTTNLNLYVAPDANAALAGDFIGGAGIQEAIDSVARTFFVNGSRCMIWLRDGVYTDMPTLRFSHAQGNVIRVAALSGNPVNTTYAEMTGDFATDKALVVSRFPVVLDYTSNRIMVQLQANAGAAFVGVMFRSSNGAQATTGFDPQGNNYLELTRCAVIEVGGQVCVATGLNLWLTGALVGFRTANTAAFNLTRSFVNFGSSAAVRTMFAHMPGVAMLLAESRALAGFSEFYHVGLAWNLTSSSMDGQQQKWKGMPGMAARFLANTGGYVMAPSCILDSLGSTTYPLFTNGSGHTQMTGITVPTISAEPGVLPRTAYAANGAYQNVTATAGDLIRSPASGTVGNSNAFTV